MGNNLIKRGNKPCIFYDKYYFGGESVVRFSIRWLLVMFSFKWFGLLGAIIGFFIPNPLSLAIKDYCMCGYAATEHGKDE
jgi:hypothetical protein